MAFRIEEDSRTTLVRVTLEGVVGKPEIESMVASARAASAKLGGWNILYDLRACFPRKVSPGELFWFPRQHPSLRAERASTVRVATLYHPKDTVLATFWEDAFRNAGLLAGAFTNELDAVKWLKYEEP